jgi:predicted porin
MKKILLASVALTAFAGAAAAEVSFSGSATLGYNSEDLTGVTVGGTAIDDNEAGFYADLAIEAAVSQTLDNGVTVSASVDLADLDDTTAAAADYTLTIATDTASLVYGDTEFAAADAWAEAGDADLTFSEVDAETVLKASVNYGGAAIAVSTEVAEGAVANELTNTQVGVTATAGSVDLTVGYQEDGGVFGISGATVVGGANVAVSYISNDANDSSTGVGVSYPMGAVTVAASYSVEEVAGVAGDDNWDISVAYAEGDVAVKYATNESDAWSLEGSYVVGNGLTVNAGAADGGDTTYMAGTYDLGGGAALLVSFVNTDAQNVDDEYGAPDYQEGTTVELSFAF